ncbi:hypothetical protein HK102_000134 [Quaeritorhiza haematococci]|nr:hypothetical protein HK102_000134 [Quaeritorhiza haematococci]
MESDIDYLSLLNLPDVGSPSTWDFADAESGTNDLELWLNTEFDFETTLDELSSARSGSTETTTGATGADTTGNNVSTLPAHQQQQYFNLGQAAQQQQQQQQARDAAAAAAGGFVDPQTTSRTVVGRPSGASLTDAELKATRRTIASKQRTTNPLKTRMAVPSPPPAPLAIAPAPSQQVVSTPSPTTPVTAVAPATATAPAPSGKSQRRGRRETQPVLLPQTLQNIGASNVSKGPVPIAPQPAAPQQTTITTPGNNVIPQTLISTPILIQGGAGQGGLGLNTIPILVANGNTLQLISTLAAPTQAHTPAPAPAAAAPATQQMQIPSHTPIAPAPQSAAAAALAAFSASSTSASAKKSGSNNSSPQSSDKQQKDVSEKDDKDLTPEELDKRRRNTAASARFRAKKKLKEQMLDRAAKEMSVRLEVLERKNKEYEMEIKWLRQLITDKEGAKRLADIYEENGLQFVEGTPAAGPSLPPMTTPIPTQQFHYLTAPTQPTQQQPQQQNRVQVLPIQFTTASTQHTTKKFKLT